MITYKIKLYSALISSNHVVIGDKMRPSKVNFSYSGILPLSVQLL